MAIEARASAEAEAGESAERERALGAEVLRESEAARAEAECDVALERTLRATKESEICFCNLKLQRVRLRALLRFYLRTLWMR